MEYQCFYLNPEFKLAHDDDAVVLFESNSLGECCNFVYNLWKTEQRDIAVYQLASGSYRDIYRNPARDAKGRFEVR
jgi:hypothetical protein